MRYCKLCNLPVNGSEEVQIWCGLAHVACAARIGLRQFRIRPWNGDAEEGETVWAGGPESAVLAALAVHCESPKPAAPLYFDVRAVAENGKVVARYQVGARVETTCRPFIQQEGGGG